MLETLHHVVAGTGELVGGQSLEKMRLSIHFLRDIRGNNQFKQIIFIRLPHQL